MCRKIILLILFASVFSLPSFSQDTSPDVLHLIDLQAQLGQSIVQKLVESLNLRETQILQEQQNLQQDQIAFSIEKINFQSEKDSYQKDKETLTADQQALQNERDTFQKQQLSQEQTDKTLNNLNKSLATSEYWHKVKNNVIIVLLAGCVVEGIFIALK